MSDKERTSEKFWGSGRLLARVNVKLSYCLDYFRITSCAWVKLTSMASSLTVLPSLSPIIHSPQSIIPSLPICQSFLLYHYLYPHFIPHLLTSPSALCPHHSLFPSFLPTHPPSPLPNAPTQSSLPPSLCVLTQLFVNKISNACISVSRVCLYIRWFLLLFTGFIWEI